MPHRLQPRAVGLLALLQVASLLAAARGGEERNYADEFEKGFADGEGRKRDAVLEMVQAMESLTFADIQTGLWAFVTVNTTMLIVMCIVVRTPSCC